VYWESDKKEWLLFILAAKINGSKMGKNINKKFHGILHQAL
jgi:hypothetical protein